MQLNFLSVMVYSIKHFNMRNIYLYFKSIASVICYKLKKTFIVSQILNGFYNFFCFI